MSGRKAARLTNPWAYIFGPLYLFCKGLWRKALIFALLLLLAANVFPESPEALALEGLLRDYYAEGLLKLALGPVDVDPASLGFTLISTLPFTALDLGVVFALAGRKLVPCLLLPLALLPFIICHLFVPGLDLGIASSLAWLLARQIWPLVVGVLVYAALSGRRFLLGVVLLLACGLYLLGLPLAGQSFPAALSVSLYLVLAFMTELDLYRRNVMRLRFWW